VNKSAIAIAAHPDDIEFFMSGTLMRLKAAGYDIHYMNVADGCCGSTRTDAATTARIRREEAKRAAAAIGASFHDSLCRDLEIFYDRPTLLKLASVIRRVAPEIVLTHSPVDYMEDHTNTCRLAVTAAFSRGMPNFPVDPPAPPIDQPVTVYHAQPHFNRGPLKQVIEPELFIDITELMDRKSAMLAEHQSQKLWLDESQGQESYLITMRELNEEIGRMSVLFRYAEGWRKHLHVGFCNPDDDPLRTALQPYALPA
jgi:LmbE family N-acetylglucosaminyl deacetylase